MAFITVLSSGQSNLGRNTCPCNSTFTHRPIAHCFFFFFFSCGPIRDTTSTRPHEGEGRSGSGRRRRQLQFGRGGACGDGGEATGVEREREMAPASGWGRALGNTRSFVGNALGGLRGWSNLASWTVAGTLAYYLWVKPARQLQKEQEVRTYPRFLAVSWITPLVGAFNLVISVEFQITSVGNCSRL